MTDTTAPLTQRADVDSAQVGNGSTEHYTPAGQFNLDALCGRRISRLLTPQQAAKMKRACTGCTTKAEAIAEERAAQHAALDAEELAMSDTPAVHRFESTGEAYDATQCDEEIRNGDVLVIESEGVVGFLVKAWPVAVTAVRGELHGAVVSIEEFEGGAYVDSHRAACAVAAELGFAVTEAPAAPEAAPAEEEPAAEAAPERFVVEFYSAVLFPGYKEQRLTVRPVGSDALSLYVALPYQPYPDPDAMLAAFGWRTVGTFEYIADANLDRAVAVRTEPADTPEAEVLRDVVAREAAAKGAARAAYAGNLHFRPVVPAGEEYPVGWTFRIGHGTDARFGWADHSARITPLGKSFPTREEAEQALAAAAMSDAPTVMLSATRALPVGTLALLSAGQHDLQQAQPAEEEAAPGRYVVTIGADPDYWPTFKDRERAVAHAASYGLTAAAVRDSTDPARIAGTRIRCSDGRVRTATRLETVHGTEWIHTEDRSAWRADKSEPIDTSRISEFRAVADAAAYRVTSAPDATDPEWRAALADLGEALSYLADADPLYAAAVGQADAERVTFTGTLADVAPGDVIHVEGIRATVLDTGTAEGDAVRGDGARWWADVLGVDKEDRAATFRRPFAVGRFADVAAAEEVTIERPLTIR